MCNLIRQRTDVWLEFLFPKSPCKAFPFASVFFFWELLAACFGHFEHASSANLVLRDFRVKRNRPFLHQGNHYGYFTMNLNTDFERTPFVIQGRLSKENAASLSSDLIWPSAVALIFAPPLSIFYRCVVATLHQLASHHYYH